jgi:hypothetical protein
MRDKEPFSTVLFGPIARLSLRAAAWLLEPGARRVDDAAAERSNATITDSDRAPTDLGAVFDAHITAEFVDRDVAATMATMAPEPYLTHVPTLAGGTGHAEVERFYRDHFVGHWPDDVQVQPLSRTVGVNRVVDELVVSFTPGAACQRNDRPG